MTEEEVRSVLEDYKVHEPVCIMCGCLLPNDLIPACGVKIPCPACGYAYPLGDCSD